MRYADNSIYTDKGSPIKILYSPVVTEDGTIDLKESGKEDLNAYIQSFADEVDLNTIIKRYTEGDFGALSKTVGSYGDFTKVPSTYAEILQMQIDTKNMFNHLPADVREKFDNDINKFVIQLGTDEWNEKMKQFFPKTDVKEEVKEESVE